MITGNSEELEQVVQTHHCPEHPDKALTVAWHPDGFYVIRCGAGHFPEEVTRELSLTEQYKTGLDLPEPVQSSVKKRLEQSTPMKAASEVYQQLGITPATDLGTGEIITPEQVMLLVNLAKRYDLDLFRGHMVLMHRKPYVTIDGYLYHASRTNVPYSLNSRPLTGEERAASLIEDGDHAWQAEVVKIPSGSTFLGIGIVTKEEMEARSPRDKTKLRSPVVAAHPWQLAQKRAEWQALRRAFPIGESEEVESEAGDKSSVS